MIYISRKNYQLMLKHAASRLPEEACGLIAGRADGELRRVEKVYLLANADHSGAHFSLDPREQLAAVRDMRSLGYAPLGNWHSHPETPARPSEEDRRLAYDSGTSYLILSLMDRENPVLKAFRIADGCAREEELTVTD